MGKSPGKWIKTLLFGKKTSKSNLSKNVTPDREYARKTPVEDNSPVVSDPLQFAEKRAENIELEKGTSGNSSVNQGLEAQSSFVSVPLSDDEMRRQGRAATKAQAVFRGYLARRAFRALKGIIRLQALIRGHLVRRQAVATLRCMQAVVRLQALARARRVDIGANSTFGSGKLSTNAYVRKLLISLPAVMPLSLQYDPAEPNSAWNWLERWSLSRFWDPPARPRKASSIKPHNKQSGSQNAENDRMKSKRTTRKVLIGDNGALSFFETDKPKRNPKKSQTDFVQEQAQNELERVKRSLRKVSASQTPAPEKLETENDKPDKVSEGKIVISAENLAKDLVVDKVDFLQVPMTANVLNGVCPLIETPSPENGWKIQNARFSNDELSSKEDESRKIRKRRSLPEYSENISLNTPRLPSYMMVTESAKAKLRAQEGSAKLISEDGTEVGYVRRYSLPASTNEKTSSLSPRVHNRVHGNGKGGNSKSSRSMASSKDDKVLQSGWRR